MNQEILEAQTIVSCQEVAKSLADSPISRTRQIFNLLGFYQGYCSAMGWEANGDLLILLCDLAD